jgi:hypothetical protein
MKVFKLLVTPLHKLVGDGHVTKEDLLHRLFDSGNLLGILRMLLVVLLAGIRSQIWKLTLIPGE